METFELKYFMAVAKTENIHKAAVNIHVSSGSLSKAISRLEDELGVQLFQRVGRHIKLTAEGIYLKQKVSDILDIEDNIKYDLMEKSNHCNVNIIIMAEELLLSNYGVQLAKTIEQCFPLASVQLISKNESDVVQHVLDSEAHFGISTQSSHPELSSKIMQKHFFRTCASPRHPIFQGKKSRKIPIDEVIAHPFVVPDGQILGKISSSVRHRGLHQFDGWNDLTFSRIIRYKTLSTKVIEKLVSESMALAYLPDFMIDGEKIKAIDVTGCPFVCHQTVRLLTKNPKRLGWLSHIWSQRL